MDVLSKLVNLIVGPHRVHRWLLLPTIANQLNTLGPTIIITVRYILISLQYLLSVNARYNWPKATEPFQRHSNEHTFVKFAFEAHIL